ncbi:MAG: hypothetical protein HC800_02755 [Phormidesmis sp. RL_2_1]|nr:hypothetical protein [Phormidesmis sp. RL_2_1]
MGKQKIDRLLAQIKDNQQRDIQNAAAIFTVAQAAVNELDKQAGNSLSAKTLSLAPIQLTKADLINRYGSYNGCRQAAKNAGIRFKRSPRWPQLIAAFNYIEACQTCVDEYIAQYPNPYLKGIKITLSLGT